MLIALAFGELPGKPALGKTVLVYDKLAYMFMKILFLISVTEVYELGIPNHYGKVDES